MSKGLQMDNKTTDKKYGSLMSGGVCPCGGRLSYCAWETKSERKERLTCKACGRSDYASEFKGSDLFADNIN